AKEQGFALSPHRKIKPHIEELRRRREAQGLWTPQRVPFHSERPPWQASSPASSLDPEYPAARRNHWTLELVQRGLLLALQQLQPGEQLTLPVLRRLAKSSREIPT